MKVAMPVWSGRISPVFDVAQRLLVVDVEAGGPAGGAEHVVGTDMPASRARRLAELGVDVLICGAISRPMEMMLAAGGIRVIPYVCGPVEEVFQAYLAGRLSRPTFLMPGCRRGRLGFRPRHRWGREGIDRNGRQCPPY